MRGFNHAYGALQKCASAKAAGRLLVRGDFVEQDWLDMCWMDTSFHGTKESQRARHPINLESSKIEAGLAIDFALPVLKGGVSNLCLYSRL